MFFYRISKSIFGPWLKPTEESDRFDENGFYAAKVILEILFRIF
jgi:hypothetical protein